MQFPQINKFESLIDKHLKPSIDYAYPYSYQGEQAEKEDMNELFSNIDQINLARSYAPLRLQDTRNTLENSQIKSNQSSEETLEFQLNQSQTFYSQRKARVNKIKKSLIFTPVSFTKLKQAKKQKELSIKIYFFNLPISKAIQYGHSTKICELIFQAIKLYIQDSSLDQTKIHQRGYQHYELRLLEHQHHYKADMTIQPISYDRLVSDNVFDSLALIYKDSSSPAKSLRSQFKEINSLVKKNTVTIHLYNELEQPLGTIDMSSTDSLDKIFTHVQNNDLHHMKDFYLTSSKNDSNQLPRDFEIRNLESNKIYIKVKKFIDQSEVELKSIKIIKNIGLLKRQERESSLNLPIGLKEASEYEQFHVIKVNNMGFEQERLLGIDQTKTYNYNQKKQTSFLSKIFGVNEQTGTKRPFRLISDILEVKTTANGFILVYKEKSLRFIVVNQLVKDKIIRKLNFLINLNRQEKRNLQKGK